MQETLTESRRSVRSEATAAPTPIRPRAEQPVNGAALVLSWVPLESASSYEVEVSEKESFDEIYFSARTGSSTSITVYKTFPTDGSTFYWRVRANRKGSLTPFSEPRPFTTVTDDEALAAEAQRQEQIVRKEKEQRRATDGKRETSGPQELGASPHETSYTSKSEARLVVGMMGGVILMFLLFAVVGL